MLKITVDEAYAFDYYSILKLKRENGSDIDQVINLIKSDIINYIGEIKFNLIINSKEYENLYLSNKNTFDAVDKAKTDQVLASYVDRCNYLRMIHKKELQSKFFSNDLSEVKLGYEKLNSDND
jgi:hypothetical protein